LREIITDPKNYKRKGKAFWGVIHAVHLIGILRDKEGIESLLKASSLSDKNEIDWVYNAIPECLAVIGPTSIPQIIKALKGPGEFTYKMTLSLSLWNIYDRYQETRDEIEGVFVSIIQDTHLDPELRGYIVGDLAGLGKKDLKPLFYKMFDCGEIDLDTITPDDLEYFFENNRIPSFFTDIESFYSDKSIKKRQERWEKEGKEDLDEEYLSYLRQNSRDIGRNDPCPCGSGTKFKKCCLPRMDVLKKSLNSVDKEREELIKYRAALSLERDAEAKIRRILAKYNKTDIFPEIKEGIIRSINETTEEFISKGPMFYLKPVMNKIDFLRNKKDAEVFFGLMMDYWNALASQLKGEKGRATIH
jgi:hypothetical protein